MIYISNEEEEAIRKEHPDTLMQKAIKEILKKALEKIEVKNDKKRT